MAYKFTGADGNEYEVPLMKDLSGFAVEQLETATLPTLMKIYESGQGKDDEEKRKILASASFTDIFKFFKIVLGEDSKAYAALMNLKMAEVVATFTDWMAASRADSAPLPKA